MQYRLILLDPVTGLQREEVWQGNPGESLAAIKQRYQKTAQQTAQQTAKQSVQILLRVEPVHSVVPPRGQKQTALSFCQEMKVLLESGLNVVEAVETLAQRADRTLLAQVYSQLRDTLRSGRSLSVGMQTFPHIFPEFFIASVQASEQSGNLVAALDRFITYREKLDELRGRLVSAALYPLIVLGVSALVILFLVGYVIPRFSVVFSDMVERLPLLTRWLLAVGLELSEHAVWWGSCFGAVVMGLIALLRQRGVRIYLANWLSQRGLIKDNVVQYALARLYRTLAMLVEAGIPFVNALQMSRAVLTENMLPAYTQIIEKIQSGQGIAQTFIDHQLTDNITGRILLAGERSGDVASAFNNMARFVEQKLTYKIDRLARILEPMIMLIVGGLIGLIVVLMYSPIFELANAIQ